MFTLGPRLVRRKTEPGDATDAWRRLSGIGPTLFQFVVALYGGYFGGGMGIVMLAAYAAMGMTGVHTMNALKNALAVLINFAAIATFVAVGKITWGPGLWMLLWATLGGYAAARFSRRISGVWVRRFVIAVAWSMTAYFLLQSVSLMLPQKPSRTALRVASWRAAHQLLERPPLVLDDPLALRILGKEEEARLRATAWDGAKPRVRRGPLVHRRPRPLRGRQPWPTPYGAASRNTSCSARASTPSRIGTRTARRCESSRWTTPRRRRGSASNSPRRASSSLGTSRTPPTDFEKESVADGLARAGFSNDAPAFFSWLGVTMYLTGPALDATLAFIGGTAKGGGVVFDYMRPLESLPLFERFVLSFMARRVARVGEPFRTRLEPPAMHAHVERAGLRVVEDLDRNAVNARYFAARSDGLRVRTSQARLLAAEI